MPWHAEHSGPGLRVPQQPGTPRDPVPTLIHALGPCKNEARVGEQALSLSPRPPNPGTLRA